MALNEGYREMRADNVHTKTVLEAEISAMKVALETKIQQLEADHTVAGAVDVDLDPGEARDGARYGASRSERRTPHLHFARRASQRGALVCAPA